MKANREDDSATPGVLAAKLARIAPFFGYQPEIRRVIYDFTKRLAFEYRQTPIDNPGRVLGQDMSGV